MKIPFGNLQRQYQLYRNQVDNAIQSVLDSGWFVLGKKVEEFEYQFALYCGAKYAVGVASGTEAIQLALMAVGVKSGDEVITVTNTCVPTVSGIYPTGATIVLCDVDERSFTMSSDDLEKKVTSQTKVILPVHLYGQSAQLDEIYSIAEKDGIIVIEDAAQAHGTEYNEKRIGSISLMTCFSFYPSKNLGCYGDGGAITTNDKKTYERLLQLRNYGQEKRYYHSIKGINSRLDELQASILTSKMPFLDEWNERRRIIANIYRTKIIHPDIIHPKEMEWGKHVYHLYVIQVRERDKFQNFLSEHGIGTMIHYPVPVHLQESYKNLGYQQKDFPVAEHLARKIISLPIYPELTEDEVNYVCDIVNNYTSV